MRNDCAARHPDRTGVLLHAFDQAQAHATNEQSRHAPRRSISTRPRTGPGLRLLLDRKEEAGAADDQVKERRQGLSDGAPPWMISH